MGSLYCEDCKSKAILSRTNYSHGKKSKSTTSFQCKKCGSQNIKTSSASFGRRRKK